MRNLHQLNFPFLAYGTLLISFFAHAGDGPFVNDDRIKTCLLQAYTAQVDLHAKTQAYTSELSELGLNDSRYCHGIELKIQQASKSKFKILAHASTLTWMVNQAKVLKKLK